MSSYKELWDTIEEFDKKHYYNNTTYQEREIKYIIKELDKIHYNAELQLRNNDSWKEVSKLILEITINNYNVDDIQINILKDRIHHLWKEEARLNIVESDEDDFSRRHFTKFTNDERRDLVVGHNKEGHDKTQSNREGFLLDFLNKDKKDDAIYETLSIYLHDDSQQKRHAMGLVDDLIQVIEAYSKKVIKEKQFRSYLDRSVKVIRSSVTDYDWNVEEQEEKLWEENKIIERKLQHAKGIKYIHGNLEDGKWTKQQIDNYIDCSSMNCRKIVKLTKKEIKQLEDGLGIDKHYCLEHKEYDETGSCYANKTMEWWDNNTGNKLPKTPILLRIGGIDKEDDDDFHEHILSRWKKFLKSHKGIVVEKERLEKFQYEKYYFYVKIKDDKTMLEFHNQFSGDFSVYMSSPEILEDGKIPNNMVIING